MSTLNLRGKSVHDLMWLTMILRSLVQPHLPDPRILLSIHQCVMERTKTTSYPGMVDSCWTSREYSLDMIKLSSVSKVRVV